MVWLATCESRRWQLNHEARTAAVYRFVTNPAIIHIQQTGCQKQSQPQPLAPTALRDERLEEVASETLGHARPIVFDSDDDLRASRPIRLQTHPNHGLVTALQRFESIVQQAPNNFCY